jgi:hypothetical protein
MALFGSLIGAFALLATTWLTKRHQGETRRRSERNDWPSSEAHEPDDFTSADKQIVDQGVGAEADASWGSRTTMA